jgi:GT2 family glycosyltransferase
MAKIEKKKPLTNNTFSLCRVDIIVPFHGEYNQVHTLVESILRHTWTNVYKIILVDDCSPNKDFLTVMKEVQTVKTVRMEQHSGFGAAVNAGLRASENNYVCILHSDCEVRHPGWLSAMGETLLKMKQSGVKLVVARSDNPMSDIPELRAAKNEHREDLVADQPLPLYCSLAHRELFRRVGMMPEYPYAWYEDEFLFWKMKQLGFRQAISGRSWVHHEGQVTINSLWAKNPEIKTIMESNRDRCLADLQRIFT